MRRAIVFTFVFSAAAIAVAYWYVSKKKAPRPRPVNPGGTVSPTDASAALQGNSLFVRATAYMSAHNVPASTDEKLRLYALFKQATQGQCNTERPGLIDVRERAKWDAWNALGDMTSKVAQADYVALVGKLKPEWISESGASSTKEGVDGGVSSDAASSGGGGGLSMAPKVSTMTMPTLESDAAHPEYEPDACDLFYCASEGDVARAAKLLAGGADPNVKNPHGEYPLHVACDRGSLEVVRILLVHGADPNVKEPMDGQTPLIYAAKEERIEIMLELIGAGADASYRDATGQSALDLCPPEHRDAIDNAIVAFTTSNSVVVAPPSANSPSGSTTSMIDLSDEDLVVVKPGAELRQAKTSK